MKRILLAIDFDEVENALLNEATILANAMSAQLVPLHAVEFVPHYAYYDYSTANTRVRDEVRCRMLEVCDRLRRDCPHVADPIVEVGRPIDVILRSADKEDVALIMLGACKHSLAARVFLGTTAERVVRQAKQPVWLAHPNDRLSVGKRVLCATDYSIASEHAIKAARELQLLFDSELTVIHVAPEPHAYPGLSNLDVDVLSPYRLYPDPEEVEEATEQDGRTDLVEAERLEQFLKGCAAEPEHFKTALAHGNAADEILKYVDEHDVDLVVLGTTGHSGLYRVLVGSTTEKVMRQLPCSVLTVQNVGLKTEGGE